MTIEKMRSTYRALLNKSGLSAETFKWRCESCISEYYDGEQEGNPTPEDWVRAAEEVAEYP